MNKIGYRINKEAVLSEHRQLDADAGFEIVLDGRPLNYFFNLEAFKRSAMKNGYYLIFEGPCEVMGCCGAYAEVKHLNGKIVFSRLFVESEEGRHDSEHSRDMPGNYAAHEIKKLHVAPDIFISPPFEFDQIEYQKLADEMIQSKLLVN